MLLQRQRTSTQSFVVVFRRSSGFPTEVVSIINQTHGQGILLIEHCGRSLLYRKIIFVVWMCIKFTFMYNVASYFFRFQYVVVDYLPCNNWYLLVRSDTKRSLGTMETVVNISIVKNPLRLGKEQASQIVLKLSQCKECMS